MISIIQIYMLNHELSFGIINMFPSIDNKMGVNSVIKLLDERVCKDPPTKCVIEALEL